MIQADDKNRHVSCQVFILGLFYADVFTKTKDIIVCIIKGRFWVQTVTIFMFFLLLSGCATTLTPEKPRPTGKERESALKRIQNFRLSGKIGVQTAKDSGSASVEWIQNNQQYHLALTGPLGTAGLTLDGHPGQVTLQMADGKHYQASSPEQLLAQQWGFELPVSQLIYWIKGLPAPGAAQTHFDTNGYLKTLNQAGWQINYISYTHRFGIDLPDKLTLTSQTLRVKLVIYDWKI